MLCKKDLREGIGNEAINRFEEIIRHNGVSDKENAFNCLTTLFICKLEDELSKDEEEELDFQYVKGEGYEPFLKRLQALYRNGMKHLMREDVFYVEDHYINRLLSLGGEKSIHNLVRKLQLYSHNEFSFIDVYNEETFAQNGKILAETVFLFQEYRFVSLPNHQLLGDFFEQLLYKNFKQNEGQFFTPLPIVRFIWNSIPVIKNPKIIDYACGSGHFLAEAPHNARSIIGIEKDYRLAKISKISLLMNGVGGNILVGDGLEETPETPKESFDILVSNPPYSISGFKSYMNLKNHFDLYDCISAKGGEIEVLFVERAVQLVKPGGIAVLILPLSFLSNTKKSYVGAREKILQNFSIRAIVELSDQAFKTTKTPTIILFMKKYSYPHVFSSHVSAEISDAYLEYIGVGKEVYHAFLQRKIPLSVIKENRFDVPASNEDKFYDKVLKQEEEKRFYFSLVYNQKTLVAFSPKDKKAQVEFLGYSWSGTRGQEGIKITRPGGKLYNETNPDDPKVLAVAIRNCFNGNWSSDCGKSETLAMPEYAKLVNTKDLLDFHQSSFMKTICTHLHTTTQFATSFPLLYASDVFSLRYGKKLSAEERQKGDFPVIGSNGIIGTHNHALVKGPVLTVGRKGSAGSVCLCYKDCWPIDTAYYVEIHAKLQVEYLYYVLLLLDLPSLATSAGLPTLKRQDVQTCKVPLPPLPVQQEIIQSCDQSDMSKEELANAFSKANIFIKPA